MLLSFERPAAGRRPAAVRRDVSASGRSPRTLKTAQLPTTTGITGPASILDAGVFAHRPAGPLSVAGEKVHRDHRQDVKGTWWMPRHQESMKGVNGCDKPRGGAEWPVIRGFPNGETQRW